MSEESIYKLFGESQDKKIILYEPEIAEALNSKTNKVTIEVRGFDFSDLTEKAQNPNYLENEELIFTDNGIKILYAPEQSTEIIKKYIPRGVKELSIPINFLTNVKYLEEFPNLETLSIVDYGYFSLEELEWIEKNTSIKNINLTSNITISDIKCQPGCNVIEAGNSIAQLGKLTLFHKGYQGKWRKSINLFTNDYDNQNLATIKALYDGISSHLEEVSIVTLSKTPETSYLSDFSIDVSNKKVDKVSIRNVTPTIAARVYKEIIKRDQVENTQLFLDNATYEDIYQLKQMNQTSKFTIKYKNANTTSEATYEEFQNMRATIDYYKEIMEESKLSPVEKVAFVYDILKTMKYKENYQNKQRSRNIHAIVTDGTIVCTGYSAFAKQLLNEVGIHCISAGVTCLSPTVASVGHERNLVRVDDNKYNIHGLYAMDITWDSDKDLTMVEEEGKKVFYAAKNIPDKAEILEHYNSLALYRHFLIPMNDYESRYPEEINPLLYTAYKEGKIKTLIKDARALSRGEKKHSELQNSYIMDLHLELFSIEEGPSTVEKYFNAPKPSLEVFKKILSTVRKEEGYEYESIASEVDRVVELHEMLNKQNTTSPNHFFKPQGTK